LAVFSLLIFGFLFLSFFYVSFTVSPLGESTVDAPEFTEQFLLDISISEVILFFFDMKGLSYDFTLKEASRPV